MNYNKNYFDWQKKIGKFGGMANRFKFERYINIKDVVLDFGCGGGYLLEKINCKKKIGIEINSIARDETRKKGISVFKDINSIKDSSVDVIISNHVLEHVDCPLKVIENLKPKLKNNGIFVLVVPHQSTNENYSESDKNFHLYTWNQMTLGNLFKKSGYKIIKVDTIRHMWPPNYFKLYNIIGNKMFNKICYIYAILKGNYQIRIVAQK